MAIASRFVALEIFRSYDEAGKSFPVRNVPFDSIVFTFLSFLSAKVKAKHFVLRVLGLSFEINATATGCDNFWALLQQFSSGGSLKKNQSLNEGFAFTGFSKNHISLGELHSAL